MRNPILELQIPVLKFILLRFNQTGSESLAFRFLEKKILKNSSKLSEIQTRQAIYSNQLFLSLDYVCQKESHLKNFRLLWWVLKARGRLRWLCFKLLPDIFKDSYEISRTKLISKIIRFRKDFNKLVLGKLFIAEDNNLIFSAVTNYEYSHPNTELTLTSKQIYLLEDDISNKLVFRTRDFWGNTSNYTFILFRLIAWNSRYSLKMIRESSLLNESENVRTLVQFIPSFSALLQETKKVHVAFHEFCELTLDERMKIKDTHYDVLKNVTIRHQRFIFQKNNWCVIDSTCSPYLEFVGGHWQFMEQTQSHFSHVFIKNSVPKQILSLKKAIFLMGRADENWYHLVLDTLPRYLLLRSLDQSIPVLIRSDLPQSSLKFLKRVLNRNILLVSSDQIVKVDDLFLVACRSTAFDSKPIDHQEIVKFSPNSIKEFRKWISSVSPQPLNKTFPRFLFISRKSKYRNLLNIGKIQREFRESGFNIVEFSEDFYEQQEHFYSNANHLVAPGGAGLANMVFMQSNSTVTSLVSWRGRGTRLWKKLSEACEINLVELIGAPTNYTFNYMARLHSNFILPLIVVRRYLRDFEKSTDLNWTKGN